MSAETQQQPTEGSLLSDGAVRQLRATVRGLQNEAPPAPAILVGASSAAVGVGLSSDAAATPAATAPAGDGAARTTGPRAGQQDAATVPATPAIGAVAATPDPVAPAPRPASAPAPGNEGQSAGLPLPAAMTALGSAAALSQAAPLMLPIVEPVPETVATAGEVAVGGSSAPELPKAQPDAPGVHAQAAVTGSGSGAEDEWITIAAGFATPDDDGSERLLDTVRIEGVPPGAQLSRGSEVAPGIWEVATADLLAGRIAIRPPADSDATIRLTLRAIAEDVDEGGRDTRELTGLAEIRIAAVADAPVATAEDISGAEDRAIPLDLSAALTDTDGSERLTLAILGVPEGAALSAGMRDADGSWSVAPADLPGLRLTPPPDFAGMIALTLRATSTEAANGDAAVIERRFTVRVDAVVDGGAIHGSAAGEEDRPITLSVGFGPLSDASERWADTVLIHGVPPDAGLDGGTPLGAGSWRVARSDFEAGRIALTPPPDSDAAIALRIEAQVLEADGAAATMAAPLIVAVTAVADAPLVSVAETAGAEDGVIPLDLAAALSDADGSERLSLVLLGVPERATLSAGTRGSDGGWRLDADDLPGLTLAPPPHFSGTLALTLRATATEAANGDAALRELPFTVTVAPRAEADAALTAGGSGAEDSWIPIAAAFVTADADGSEGLADTVLIAGLPSGGTLNQGVEVAPGQWSVSRAELLAGHVALRPPADSDTGFALTLTATLRDTSADGVDTRQLTARAEIRIAAVADAPLAAAEDAAGDEDRAIPLALSAGLADADGSESLAIVILGLPEGATLSAGTRNADGSWSVPAADLAGLSFTPPRDFAGDIPLTLRATTREAANGDTTSVEHRFTVKVAAVMDGADLSATASGAEDSAIPILAHFGASSDASERWDDIALVRGVPTGAQLNRGEDLGDGVWRVDRAALVAGAIAISPPADSDAPIPLTIEAVLRDTEGDGAASTVTIALTVQVAAVADAPIVGAVDAFGAEDAAIALDLAAALTDADGSESLALRILGVPDGATLSAGLRNADGSWSLDPADLAGLTLTPPRDFAGEIALTLRTTSTEAANGDAATADRDFTVHVAPVADAATITAGGTGAEDGWIAIRGMLATTDRDGSETLGPTLTIGGVPDGATLSHGSETAPGIWTVPRAAFEAGELAIHPPANSDADITLRISLAVNDGADSKVTEASATIVVRAVADSPTVQVADAAGREDTPIRLAGLGGALTDTDGSETLSFIVVGVPSTARLTAGTRGADGSWSLTAAQLSTVSLLPPANFSGRMDLSLTAVATEARDGAPAARTTAPFTVTVDPVADAGRITGSKAGNEDGWIQLKPSYSTPDADGSESWSATTHVSGVPAGAMLNRGTRTAPGEWAVPTADLKAGLVSIRPPADSDADFSVTLRATLSDAGNGLVVTREITGSYGVTVRAVADAPLAAAADSAGAEDTAIALDLSAALIDTDGSEALALRILGVPGGATLSAGARNADGSWSVDADALDGLTMTPPRDFSGSIALTLRATTTEARDGTSATVERSFVVTVDAVADTPTLRTGPAIGLEDSDIALRISAAATDSDGSERIAAFRILDVPDGAVLRAGGAVLAREPDGSVLVDSGAAPSLTVTPPPDSDADFTLRITAIAEEPNGSRAESAPRELPVRVDAVADTPIWLRVGAEGAEDSAIPLDLSARLGDADGSERLYYVISGVPDGAILSAGRWRGPGSWSLTADEAADVTLTPPADFSGTITLTAAAVAQEGNGGAQAVSSVSFPVRVAALLDSTNWSATARGAEDTPIPLNLAAPLRDRDGSERMVGEAVVEGIPAGAVLRLADGSVVATTDGVARIAVDRLAGTTMTMPRDSDLAAQLTVRVTVQDEDGTSASLRGIVTVDPSGIADTPELKVESVGMSGHGSSDPSSGWAGLPIRAALTDTDGSEALHLWVRDVPAGFLLSAGVAAGDGVWLLREADLPGLQIRPPAGYEGSATLRVQAVAVEREGHTTTHVSKLELTVKAAEGEDIGDGKDEPGGGGDPVPPAAPKLQVAAAEGSEDTTVPLGIVLVAAEPGTTLSVIVSGLPAGARLSTGFHDPERDVWVLRPEELDRLLVIPPRDFAGEITPKVTAFAMDGTGRTTSTTDSASLHVEAVADGPAISAAPPASAEDASVPLNLAIAGRDADGSEGVVAVTLSGLSAGARIAPAAGITANGDGTWTVDPSAIAAVRLIPPENAHGTFGLTVTATVREESNGATATSSRSVSVSVSPMPDAPTASAADVTGTEDQPIALGLAAALVDRDGSEAMSVVIAGLPEGARLSAGINNGDGSWTLTPAQLAGLSVTPPGDWSGSMALTLHAHAMERSTGQVATTSVPFRVSVLGSADAPLVDAAATATGEEDTAISLDIVARLTDRDGSETLALIATGVPAGAQFSAGYANPDGSWTIPGDALAGLAFTPPPHFAGTLRLDFAATASEADGDAVATRFQLAVTVDPVADAPLLSLAAVAGAEDTAIPLHLAATLADADGSESIARFLVAGMPTGATLSAGTRGSDGVWTLTAEQAATVTLTPPPNFSGSLSLSVTAVSQEAANGDQAQVTVPLDVVVTPVADAPNLALIPATGAEDSAIRLPIAATLADTDGSESLARFVVAGVPDGFALSAGTRGEDGQWTLTPAEAAIVGVIPPADWSGRFELTITAVARENATGEEASRSAILPVTVNAVADVPLLSAADASGAEDHAVSLDLSAMLADTDGSESIAAVTISGLPAGFALSAGTALGAGLWRLQPPDLDGLRLAAPADWHGTLALSLNATAHDGSSTASAARSFAVTITPENDAPVLTLAAATEAATGQQRAVILADAAITDVDSPRMGSATVTLAGAEEGDGLVFEGYDIREEDGRSLLGDTGIAMTRAPDGTVTLSGPAAAGTYERVLESLAIENPAGLSAGTRGIAVTLRDEDGAAAGTRSVALDIAPSVIHGGDTDAHLSGTAGHDSFHGGVGNETMAGGAGADLFIVSAGGGHDRIEGGDGSWLDRVHVEGVGAPGEGGWTLVLDAGVSVTQGDRAFDFAEPASGTIHFADGGQVELAQIERITW
ncbi:Ig-like domain-containing protein [Roseomonas sp. AR75]|uniref:Ig-like domain-containing protein n=1 Tax=Roseomonas sp. AR75 TaxID=2562311 RepID=UPI0010C06594|nr:Ig-like domain-containing protein [Roseomonas sp. AR75]